MIGSFKPGHQCLFLSFGVRATPIQKTFCQILSFLGNCWFWRKIGIDWNFESVVSNCIFIETYYDFLVFWPWVSIFSILIGLKHEFLNWNDSQLWEWFTKYWEDSHYNGLIHKILEWFQHRTWSFWDFEISKSLVTSQKMSKLTVMHLCKASFNNR